MAYPDFSRDDILDWFGKRQTDSQRGIYTPGEINDWVGNWQGQMQGYLDGVGYNAGTVNNAWNSTRQNIEGLTPDFADWTGYSARQQTMNPSQTTAGLLNQLVETGSPYLEQAKRNAAVQANSRGLLNSALAAGAGAEAAIAAAAPIAESDAAKFYQTEENNARYVNAEREFNATAFNQNQEFNADASNNMKQFRTSAMMDSDRMLADQAQQDFANQFALAGARIGIDDSMSQLAAGALLETLQMRLSSDLDWAKLTAGSVLDHMEILKRDEAAQDQLIANWYKYMIDQGFYSEPDDATEEQKAQIRAARKAAWEQFIALFGEYGIVYTWDDITALENENEGKDAV